MRRDLRASLTVLTLLSPLLAASGAGAVPIIYTETTTATGMLGSATFTDSPVTVSFAGDTSGVTSLAPGVLINPAGVASVTVAGVGPATFTGSGLAAVNDQAFEGAGIGAEASAPPSTGSGTPPSTGSSAPASTGPSQSGTPPLILGTTAPAFTTYDLTTAIGPITGSATIDPGVAFPTTSGDFVLTSAGDATFTASVTGSPVSEPGSLAMLGAGLVGLACWRRAGRCSSPVRAG